MEEALSVLQKIIHHINSIFENCPANPFCSKRLCMSHKSDWEKNQKRTHSVLTPDARQTFLTIEENVSYLSVDREMRILLGSMIFLIGFAASFGIVSLFLRFNSMRQ